MGVLVSGLIESAAPATEFGRQEKLQSGQSPGGEIICKPTW